MSLTRVALYPKGLEVSSLIYGAWRLFNSPVQGHEPTVKRLIDLCLDHSITTFDHADIYGGYQCEELFGRCFDPARRERIELITKCGIRLVSPARPHHRMKSYDTSAEHMKQSVERSLINLRTDYIDLLLIHRPDPLMDADLVAATFEELKKAGKVRAFGVSNFLPAQFDLLQSRCKEPLVTNQIEMHPLRSSIFFDGTLDHAQRLRYRPMAWSPLAGGRLADHPQLTEVLQKHAEAHGCSLEAMALAWLRRHPSGPVPIVGSTQEERLKSILAAAEITVDNESWYEILQAAMRHEIP